jgi:DNA-binding PadR family transcriptional regulator
MRDLENQILEALQASSRALGSYWVAEGFLRTTSLEIYSVGKGGLRSLLMHLRDQGLVSRTVTGHAEGTGRVMYSWAITEQGQRRLQARKQTAP